MSKTAHVEITVNGEHHSRDVATVAEVELDEHEHGDHQGDPDLPLLACGRSPPGWSASSGRHLARRDRRGFGISSPRFALTKSAARRFVSSSAA